MNAITVRRIAIAASLCAVSFASVAQTAAASPCDNVLPLSTLQKNVMSKAEQGFDSLRDYLFVTRGVYNLSMEEAVAMVDRQRDALRGCKAVTALATTR